MEDIERVHFKHVRQLFEASIKLRMSAVPLATACTLYHKFFHNCHLGDYDPNMVMMTSIYLAGKVEEEHVKLRDVINVCYNILHKDEPPLEIGSKYWDFRDAIVNFELFMMRVMKFQVKFTHPHKYLLHYYKSLKDWLNPKISKKVPIVNTAWSLLRDSYHSDLILHHKPQHIAVAVLYLALQCHGVDVPHDAEADTPWPQALCDGLRTKDMEYIVERLIAMYDTETDVYRHLSQPRRRTDTPSDAADAPIIPGF